MGHMASYLEITFGIARQVTMVHVKMFICNM
jgi:hypothetical protein